MKIAIYSHSIPPAVDGVSRRMASLVQQLSKDGHEVRRFAGIQNCCVFSNQPADAAELVPFQNSKIVGKANVLTFKF